MGEVGQKRLITMKSKSQTRSNSHRSVIKDNNADTKQEVPNKEPKDEIQRSERKSKDCTSIDRNQQIFNQMMKKNIVKFSVASTPGLLKNAIEFFQQKLSKLTFLNEQMMEAYARALLHDTLAATMGVKLARVKLVSENVNKEVFNGALEEVRNWKALEESVTSDDNTCNLYKII